MNKVCTIFAVSSLFVLPGMAQDYGEGNNIPTKSTYEILATDSKADIIRKAAHVVPTDNQFAALQNEFIAFIHFGPNTFTRMEWGNGFEDPSIFDLKNLDTDQWVASMKDAGMTMVILTVKHHEGFVLWQSRYTDHGIMSTGFQDGKGDILKDLSASCQKYGLKLGVYLSPADLYQIENEKGLYGNLSEYTDRQIPRKVEGRPFTNKTTFNFKVDDYNEYFLNQLFELLTEYGPIHEVWFDGAHPKTKGGQKYNYPAWRELIGTLAPEAVIFGNDDVRWCGNESGSTRHTEWNVIPYDGDPLNANIAVDMEGEDIGSREQLYKAKFLKYQQAETNTSLREGWFYRDDNFQRVRNADDVFDMYERSVGGNSTFLLNIPPNREGKFSQEDVTVLAEVGKRIRESYGVNLLAGAEGAKQTLDTDLNTATLLDSETGSLTYTLGQPTTINRFMIQEAIQTNGERIEQHALDAWVDGAWKEVAAATNVGYKRILRFADVTSDKFRLRVLNARALPAVSEVGAFFVNTRPPQLMLKTTLDGKISIEPLKHEFGWKPHGEDVLKNLIADYQIHYTLDGSKPTAASPIYESELTTSAKHIKAMAIGKNGLTGAVLEEDLALAKQDWRVVSASSELEKREAKAAIDGSAQSFWMSQETGASQAIVIDLGKAYTLSSFTYTPQRSSAKGMMAKGRIMVSTNGKQWKEAGSFEFGNLINDPSPRNYRLPKAQKAKFVKIESTEIAAEGKQLSIAELDFFN